MPSVGGQPRSKGHPSLRAGAPQIIFSYARLRRLALNNERPSPGFSNSRSGLSRYRNDVSANSDENSCREALAVAERNVSANESCANQFAATRADCCALIACLKASCAHCVPNHWWSRFSFRLSRACADTVARDLPSSTASRTSISSAPLSFSGDASSVRAPSRPMSHKAVA